MFKTFMRMFSPKYDARLSRNSLATVVRRSCECREHVAAKFWRIYNAKISQHSYDCRTNVVRQSRDSLQNTCEHLATIWREIKTRRHECRETRSRMSRDCRTNENETIATFVGIRTTLSRSFATVIRQSRDYRATVARYISKIRPKFSNLSHTCKCPFNETAT